MLFEARYSQICNKLVLHTISILILLNSFFGKYLFVPWKSFFILFCLLFGHFLISGTLW